MRLNLAREELPLCIVTTRNTGKHKLSTPVDQAKIDKALRYIGSGELTKEEAARLASIGVATLYRYLKDLKEAV